MKNEKIFNWFMGGLDMKTNNIIAVFLILCISSFLFTGCSDPDKEVDFSEIQSVCELATLKCYYHNVAKSETEASGLLKIFGVGYKKIWTEYSGIVELGIDVNKVSISKPDAKGVVKIIIPDAEILNVNLDEDSMKKPLTDTGFLTKVTKEEETAALASAQADMEKTAKENQALLTQARERAKKIIESYVKNAGGQVGETYTVEWIESH